MDISFQFQQIVVDKTVKNWKSFTNEKYEICERKCGTEIIVNERKQ